MTASNGSVSSEERKNYFNSVQTYFPEPDNGKIDTFIFLEAAKGVVSLIDQFGNVFAPVRYDMNGNIEKLLQVYDKDRDRHKSLNDMVLLEKSAGGILATDALLWLRRALNLIQRFFELIVEDQTRSEDLVVFLKSAYRETLNPYHGWHLTLLFNMVSRMCPTRSKVMQVISLGRPHSEDTLYADMAAFTSTLRQNVQVLRAFYQQHQLECEKKANVAPTL